ncbi:hypothetical protein AYI70_g7138 [Smittium culicis]|uniref:Uncharacterized protein n=1 Tax=Smittium culicis TaxID=133412 RepID=A0A1R1XLY0_9FUNG|nr:hypothetical protein AYI70_g7138 [Smittium culicis]
MYVEFNWEGPINVCSSTTCEIHAPMNLVTKKQSSVDIEFMDIDCNSDEASHSEPDLLEEPNVVIERTLIVARVGGLH